MDEYFLTMKEYFYEYNRNAGVVTTVTRDAHIGVNSVRFKQVWDLLIGPRWLTVANN